MEQRFTVKSTTDVSKHRALNVSFKSTGWVLNGVDDIATLCADHYFSTTKTTPLPPTYYNKDSSQPHYDIRSLQVLIGRLLFLAETVQPAIQAALNTFFQFLVHPARIHYAAVLHVLQYLSRYQSYGVTLVTNAKSTSSLMHTDVEHGRESDRQTRYCVTIYYYGCWLISKSQKLRSITLSTCESELKVFVHELQDIVFFLNILHFVGVVLLTLKLPLMITLLFVISLMFLALIVLNMLTSVSFSSASSLLERHEAISILHLYITNNKYLSKLSIS